MIAFIGRIDNDVGQNGDSKKFTVKNDSCAVSNSLEQNGADITGRFVCNSS